MNRVLTVARLHVVGWPGFLGWPWGILASSFLVNLAIWNVVEEAGSGSGTGGVVSLPIVAAVAASQWVTRLLPLAMALGASRRAFFLATLLACTALAAVHGTGLLLGDALERATGGWGASLEFFGAFVPEGAGAATRWAALTAPVLAALVAGVATGAVLQRWGTNGLFVTTSALVLVLGGAAVLVSARGWWGDLGDALTAMPAATLLGALPLALAAALAGAAWAALRRTTP
ncbi:hypothetical protein [Vallicoccus soli]|uniref:Uncharacterized protein n=1 Tax=Vallicoccus soli TaxID=2339232 RepID=A0A3A3Z3R3_9ACTN|nr:hypothetical protein [Vallicoccus soli]RJK96256.1 hypothetical protein D5H78_08285 [Vallicoccus soli]